MLHGIISTALVLLPLADMGRQQAAFDGLLELQPQTVTVRFRDADSAVRARLRPLPLFGGAEWAVTSRWDDNCLTDLKTRAVLLAHGHRGTFFLNDPTGNFYGKDYGLLGDRAARDVGQIVAAGGTTIGGHSLTHPMLSYQNRNRIFEEILGCRIALEATYDTCVNAYAFSFCDYRSSIEGVDVQRDIATLLGRAGYLQIANHRFASDDCWPWSVAGLLPPDGRPIDAAFKRFLADKQLQHDNPAITYSMHSWYSTPDAWAGFEADLDRYGHRPNWWYCNHNEYGAYRAQYRNALAGKAQREDNRLIYQFTRPSMIDLDDTIPLTFEISGVQPDAVVAIESDAGKIERVLGPDNRVRFHLHQMQSLPRRVDHVATDGAEPTASTKFPAVVGLLGQHGARLALRLENRGSEPLEVQRVTYRLPLRYHDGVVRRGSFVLQAGQGRADELALQNINPGSRYQAGSYFFVAQIDFTLRGSPGRVYFTTHSPSDFDDASYPQRGLALIGPIARAQVELSEMTTVRVKQLERFGWTAQDGHVLAFRPIDATIAEPLNVEVIPVRGRWDNRGLQPCIYWLRSTLHSPESRQVRFLHDANTVPAVWVNGNRVVRDVQLAKGDNDMVLAYVPPSDQAFSREHAGPMFRTVDAQTGQRVANLNYQP